MCECDGDNCDGGCSPQLYIIDKTRQAAHHLSGVTPSSVAAPGLLCCPGFGWGWRRRGWLGWAEWVGCRVQLQQAAAAAAAAAAELEKLQACSLPHTTLATALVGAAAAVEGARGCFGPHGANWPATL